MGVSGLACAVFVATFSRRLLASEQLANLLFWTTFATIAGAVAGAPTAIPAIFILCSGSPVAGVTAFTAFALGLLSVRQSASSWAHFWRRVGFFFLPLPLLWARLPRSPPHPPLQHELAQLGQHNVAPRGEPAEAAQLLQ
jgi:hypothetical protein